MQYVTAMVHDVIRLWLSSISLGCSQGNTCGGKYRFALQQTRLVSYQFVSPDGLGTGIASIRK